MPDLVIVESPAKAKTIKKYLGAGYDVVASMGHIRDLPKSKLGVDVENVVKGDTTMTKEEKKKEAAKQIFKAAKGLFK